MAKKRANGEGNIRKRKDGRWEGRYTAGYDEKTGKRLIKNVLGKTQAEVKEKLAKAVAEAESVDVRRADEYTLGTWLQTWYELYAKPHLRFSTAEYYRRGIELHIIPRLGDIPLKKLTGRDLQWLYKDLQEHGRLREAQKGKQPGLSDSTIRGIHTMLHNALARAVKERLILRNPANDCIPPKIPKHEMKILPPEQIKSYLTAADQRGVLPMFYLELISGLRKGELVALQWSDLDVENKTISVSKQAGRNNAGKPDITRPKTENSIRKISIPQDAVDFLIAEHQKHPNNPWMFPSPKTGEMYHPDSVVNIHKKILKCLATSTQASRSAPTPTSRGRCRKAQPKRWVISWHRSCEKTKKKHRTAERMTRSSSPPLFGHFAVWVAVWVRQIRRPKIRTNKRENRRKSYDFHRFLELVAGLEPATC